MKKNIRFLVTERCNYNCYFCSNKEGGIVSKRNLLTVNDYVNLYLIHEKLTCNKGVTIAGGEPLIYGNIDELVMNLYQNGAQVTLTTNGSYIEDHLTLFKYVKKVYIDIHTLNEASYEKIVGVNSLFKHIKKNVETLRELYGNLKIVLNIVNCPENNLNILELREILNFSKTIKADVQLTGVDSNNSWNSITFDELYANLVELGCNPIEISGRLKRFLYGENCIYFKQCIFPIDRLSLISIKYCNESEEIVVHDDARFSVGDFKENTIDFYEDIEQNDYKKVMSKMKNILSDSSKKLCIYCLKQLTKN